MAEVNAPPYPQPTISGAPKTGPSQPPPPTPKGPSGLPVLGGTLSVNLPRVKAPNVPSVTVGFPPLTLSYELARAFTRGTLGLGRDLGQSLAEQLRRSRWARPQPIPPFQLGPLQYSGGAIPGLVGPAGQSKGPTGAPKTSAQALPPYAQQAVAQWQAAYDAQEVFLNLYNRGPAQAAVAAALMYGDDPIGDSGGNPTFSWGGGGGGGGGSRNSGFALGLTNWRI